MVEMRESVMMLHYIVLCGMNFNEISCKEIKMYHIVKGEDLGHETAHSSGNITAARKSLRHGR
jgi:hypothetical protein